MTSTHGATFRHAAILVATFVMTLFSAPCGHAFSLDSYAAHSALSQGHWVKVRTGDSGLYLLSNEELRQWGFSNPEKVRVHGYGAYPINDRLTADNYVDDLPEAMSEVTPEGVVFFAAGPLKPELNNSRISFSRNHYSDHGYYFVTESDSPRQAAAMTGIAGGAADAATTFICPLLHEKELISGGNTGHELLGEDFSRTRTRNFSFDLKGNQGSEVEIACTFATKTVNGTSELSLLANGVALMPDVSSTIPATTNDLEHHYTSRTIHATAPVTGDRLDLTVNFNPHASVRLARLDKITVNYIRSLALDDGSLTFGSHDKVLRLSGATAGLHIWDITNPAAISSVNYRLENGSAVWTPTETGHRQYMAWSTGTKFQSAERVSTVGNTDIHGSEVPDMVIITPGEWAPEARRLASLHSAEIGGRLDAKVVVDEDVYNEFSSGVPDFNAFRRMLKMFWDRSGNTGKLKYVLMFGRGIYDHRLITDALKGSGRTVLPQWQTSGGEDDHTSFTTEDFLAFLDDGSGASPGRDRHCIAVGRIPVTSKEQAVTAVDKIEAYMSGKDHGDWKNIVILAADDGNNGTHLKQMEKIHTTIREYDPRDSRSFTKVYVDAFTVTNRVAKEAHDRMLLRLKQGALWWWYTGHANTYSWTSEGLLTKNDLDEASFKHPPMLLAATCSFLQWDLVNESGAEQLFFNPGGIIGAIAATRPVYINRNVEMALAVAKVMSRRNEAGRTLPVGEILRLAKNSIPGNDTNKLRFVLLGDPALRIAEPCSAIVIDSIDGVAPGSDNRPTIKARQKVTVEGHIEAPHGDIDSDFNGRLYSTLYDAEHSVTTQGHDGSPRITFEQQGDRLNVTNTDVVGGKFRYTITMPAEISYNYRSPALSLYAKADGGTDASGVNRDFYIYGYDETADNDTIPPVIECLLLNSDDFKPGHAVNESPMVIARISDNEGINMSGAGIGHQMSLQLDDDKSFSDLLFYYTPDSDDSNRGTLHYPLNNLEEGPHTITLRVWDTSGNFSEATTSFTVIPGLAPDIVELYADSNPAIDYVNFYVRHNRPDCYMEVNFAIYDMLGRMVWCTSQAGRSDMFVTSPVRWDLTDLSGRRVPRGIYIYRADISTDGTRHAAAARKIAVTTP